MSEQVNSPQAEGSGKAAMMASRRRLLRIGAVAAPAIVTLSPGAAWAATSTVCSAPIPDQCYNPTTAPYFAAKTPGVDCPPGSYGWLQGQDISAAYIDTMFNNQPGTSADHAYFAYLQNNMVPGHSCFCSVANAKFPGQVGGC